MCCINIGLGSPRMIYRGSECRTLGQQCVYLGPCPFLSGATLACGENAKMDNIRVGDPGLELHSSRGRERFQNGARRVMPGASWRVPPANATLYLENELLCKLHHGNQLLTEESGQIPIYQITRSMTVLGTHACPRCFS